MLRAHVERLIAADSAGGSPVDEPALAHLDPIVQHRTRTATTPLRVGSEEG